MHNKFPDKLFAVRLANFEGCKAKHYEWVIYRWGEMCIKYGRNFGYRLY